MTEYKLKFQTEYFTGIRPTGELTIANYVGAVAPLLSLQNKHPVVFVADLHAMTTNDPREITQNIDVVIESYLAFGLDPKKVNIYIQSAIQPELGIVTQLLSNYVTLAELKRQPALKEKVVNAEKAGGGLLYYPILMAADILSQDAHYVPVGDDQKGHIELTRILAQRVNNRFGPVFNIPELHMVKEPPRIKALRSIEIKSGSKIIKKVEKMSKSKPETALLMTDSPEIIRKKIMRAETGIAGTRANELIKSLAVLAENLAPVRQRSLVTLEMKHYLKRHESGEQIMGEFKRVVADIAVVFIRDFASRRQAITSELKQTVLKNGNELARKKTRIVLDRLINAGAVSKYSKFW